MDVALLFKALCLVLVIEGLPLVLAPERAREAARNVSLLQARQLRVIGLVLMLLGAGLLMVMK